jgi:hypothetical protein
MGFPFAIYIEKAVGFARATFSQKSFTLSVKLSRLQCWHLAG